MTEVFNKRKLSVYKYFVCLYFRLYPINEKKAQADFF